MLWTQGVKGEGDDIWRPAGAPANTSDGFKPAWLPSFAAGALTLIMYPMLDSKDLELCMLAACSAC